MICGLRTECKPPRVLALDIDQKFVVFAPKPLQHSRMNNNFHIVDGILMLPHHGMEGALKLDAHCHGAFYFSTTVAIRARLEDGAAD